MTGVKSRIMRGAAWVTAGRALVNLIGVASTILLARLLAPADFGIVAIASTVGIIAAAFTELSLATALIQHRNPQDEHFHSAWTLNVVRSGGLAIIIAAAAWPTAWLYQDDRLIPLMLVSAFTALMAGFSNPKIVLFSRELEFWQDFSIQVSQKILGFVVAIVIALVWHNYWALIFGSLVAQIWVLIASYIFLPYRPRISFQKARELMSFSIWLSLGQAMNMLNWRADFAVIGYFFGQRALGQYSVGDNLASLPTREATTPLGQTLFPGFAKIAHDRARLVQAYQRSQSLIATIALPAGVGFALVAEPLVLVAMGPKWLPAVAVIQPLSVSFAVLALGMALQPLALALGETRRLFHRDLANFSVRIPLMIVGLVTYGFAGIIYARCISIMITTVLNLLFVRSCWVWGLSPSWSAVGGPRQARS